MKLAPPCVALSRLSLAAVLAVGIGAVTHAPAALAQTAPSSETTAPTTAEPVAPAASMTPDAPAATTPAVPAVQPTDVMPVPSTPAVAPAATAPAAPEALPTDATPVPSTPADATATATPSADDTAEPATTPALTAAPGLSLPAEPQAIPVDALPHDLSPMGMYQQADIVVKAVMLGLIFASIITWTILIVKLVEYLAGMASISRGASRIESAESLRAALAGATSRGPDARMLRAAAREMNRSAAGLSPEGVRERIGSHLAQIQARAARHMGRGTGVLATIGSTAPFVGLFGTVWGIMNSFIGISQAQTTNLAVVAPGIAEALLATAIGLIAAIPAVVIYNLFVRAISGYRLRLAETAAGVERLVSRDLDRAAAGMAV